MALREILIVLVLAPATAAVLDGPPPTLTAYVQGALHVSSFKWGQADLDGDGRAEQFVLASDAAHCGSGGCTLLVLRERAGAYRPILRTTVTRPPIQVLATRSHGWGDIAVGVGGGGLAPGMAILRFDGDRYPGNPTLAPRLSAPPRGTVVIPD